MNEHLGVGVMIHMFGGNEKTVNAYKASVGKRIKEARLDPGANNSDGAIVITFDDEDVLTIVDDGRSCCESRYMTTDDDMTVLCGATLQEIEIAEAPNRECEYGDAHEVQFLKIKTDKGTVTAETHNVHNGYYGGFWIELRLKSQEEQQHERTA